MEARQKEKLILFIGACLGALLGAGAAYLMLRAPKDLTEDDPNPLSAGDIIGLTAAAATLVRRLDHFRRRL